MLFITGTDTDAGKTYVTARIICSLKLNLAIRTLVKKPIASGCVYQDGKLVSTDALTLAEALGSRTYHDEIVDYLYEPPISPQRAIQQANQNVTINDLMEKLPLPVPPQSHLIIEGAGGWLSPLTTDGNNETLAKALNATILLVVANRLGCINHCLLSLQAIKQSGLNIAGIIVNDIHRNADPDNFKDIQRLVVAENIPCLHLPFSSSDQFKPIEALEGIPYFKTFL